ncbi:MAG TPA: ABC transporter ATP-binding protein [Candidatus Limnocylindria bacterium]
MILAFHGVSHRYASDGPEALRAVDLAVAAGERVALVGASGAGKTTFARLALGLLRPSAGWIELAGRRTADTPVSRLAESGGLVLQNPIHQLFTERVGDEIALGVRGRPDAEARVASLLDRFALGPLRDRHPLRLSEGERRRVAIAATLARSPRLLVLDEPTLGQDDRQRASLALLVRELAASGTAVIAISHDPEFVNDACERVVVLDAGRVVADLPLGGDPAGAAALAAAGVPLAEVPATVVALARSGRIVAARSVADLVAAVRR